MHLNVQESKQGHFELIVSAIRPHSRGKKKKKKLLNEYFYLIFPVKISEKPLKLNKLTLHKTSRLVFTDYLQKV